MSSVELLTLEKEFDSTLKNYKQTFESYQSQLENIVKYNSYVLLSVNTNDSNLYVMDISGSTWIKIQDNSNGTLVSVSTLLKDNRILACNKEGNILFKKNYSDTEWTQNTSNYDNLCCFKKVEIAPDNTMIGLKNDGKLYIQRKLTHNWVGPIQFSDPSENLIDFTLCPDGSILGVNSDNTLCKHSNYENLNEKWVQMGTKTCCVKSIHVSPDGRLYGVDTNNNVVYNENYKNISMQQSKWNIIPNTCCVESITTALKEIPDASVEGFTTLSSLNSHLINLNEKIQKQIDNTQPQYEDALDKINQSTLNETYKKLLQDKNDLNNASLHLQTLENKNRDGKLYVQRNRILYIFVLLFVVFLFFLIFKFFFTKLTEKTVESNSLI
jgi:hypothetical protein